MKVVFVILCFICILIVMIFISKWKINIEIVYRPSYLMLTIQVNWMFIRMVNKSIRIDHMQEGQKDTFHALFSQLQDLYKMLPKVNPLVTTALQHIVIRNWRWYTEGGLGDAALTGMTAGGLWGIKGVITSWIMRKTKKDCRPDLQVKPLFQQSHFEMFFSCMVSTRITHAIHTFVKLIASTR
ncbi:MULTISPECIES: DUF2953 domain-containing protein [Clostridia]|uniref:DUF2953 domain-containing protein n=1 Tax=Clostridia TaxID=186801 RepID=UPI001314FBA4|nr:MULTISPECIES: DUF2953 domain-containing protein [Clostridia]